MTQAPDPAKGIHEVMGSIPISSTNSDNDLGTRHGGRDASEPRLCHVCVTFPLVVVNPSGLQ